MARHTHTIPVEQREALVEDARANGCTLDGEPAYVSGSRLDFARVHRKDGRGGNVEFAWATVQRILSTHRNFQS
jgi:hypothetical protein